MKGKSRAGVLTGQNGSTCDERPQSADEDIGPTKCRSTRALAGLYTPL
jgi:hypothetical protein